MSNALVKVNTAVVVNVRWFEFRQNNSGGSFVYDENVGKSVFVQARNAREANDIAERAGVYFDGVDAGWDCSCCGDRWYGLWSDDEGSEDMPQEYLWNVGMVDFALMDTVPDQRSGYSVFHFYDGTRMYGVPQIPEGVKDTRVV